MKNSIIYIVISLLLLMLGTERALSQNVVKGYIETLEEGNSWTLDVQLDATETNFTAFQMDVTLPVGVEVVEGSLAPGSRLMGHTLLGSSLSGGIYRVIAYSDANAAIPGRGASTIFTLQLRATTTLASAKYEVVLSKIRFSLRSGKEMTLSNAKASFEVQSAATPTYSITYMVDGKTFATDTLEVGAEIIPPTAPDKEGHTFVEWEDLPKVMPAHDLVVSAAYEVNTYSVYYYLDGALYTTQQVKYGEKIVPPAVDLGEHMTFEGWQDVPVTMPAHDVYVYGASHVTALTGVDAQQHKSLRIYDLSGRAVHQSPAGLGKLKKGLYIINGRKVYVH